MRKVYQDDLSADGEDFGHRLDGRALDREVDGHDGPGRGRLVVVRKRLESSDLGLDVVHLQLVGLALDGVRHLVTLI